MTKLRYIMQPLPLPQDQAFWFFYEDEGGEIITETVTVIALVAWYTQHELEQKGYDGELDEKPVEPKWWHNWNEGERMYLTVMGLVAEWEEGWAELGDDIFTTEAQAREVGLREKANKERREQSNQ